MHNILQPWASKNHKIYRIIKHLNLAYTIIVLSALSLLFYAGFSIKEDISITIVDFSINLAQGPDPGSKKIVFEGIVPEEMRRSGVGENDIRAVKLYVSDDVQNSLKDQKKYVLQPNKVSFSTISLQNKPSYFNNSTKNKTGYNTISMLLISAILKPVDIQNRNVALLIEMEHAENSSELFEKAKLILGETTLLHYWADKMFSSSPLFKKAGYVVE